MRALALLLVCAGIAACGNHDKTVDQPAAASSAAAQQHAQAVIASGPSAAPAKPAVAASAPAIQAAGYGGYGDLHFGLSEADFRKNWGDLKGGPPAAGSTCMILYPIWITQMPADIGFMFEGDKFVRFDIRTAKEAAPGGGKVGMTAEQLLALYPAAQKQPQKYYPDAFTLRVAGDGGAALVFEIGKDGKVTAWRVGLPPQIDYVEGCG
jgi:opacity protein-like surface antigen